MVTVRNQIDQSNSTYFGGVFFTKVDNKEIKNLADLKGKLVKASSILAIGAAPANEQMLREF